MKFLSALVLSLCVLPLWAQTAMSENTDKETFLVKYNLANNTYLNDILNRLAQSNGKPLNTVELVISLEKYVRVALEGRAGISYEAKIQLKPLEVKGETSYRGFNISNFLVPTIYSFEAKKDVGTSESILKVFNNSPANDQGVFVTFIPFVEGEAELNKIKIKLQKLSIGYNAAAKEHFDFITGLIDTYYEQKIGMANLRTKLQNVSFADPAKLETNQRELVFLERQIQNLQRFSKDLDLNTYDPIGFQAEYAQLQQQLNDKKSSLESTKQNIHELYYQQGMTHLNNGQENAASQMFQKAIQQKENFALAHFQLARIAYMNGDFDAAERKLDYTRRNTEVDYQAESFINDLYSDIVAYHVNKGNKEFRDLEFDKSLKEYEKASQICEKIYGYRNCRNEIQEKVVQAASGKMEYLVMQVREEIFAQNLNTAATMIGEAKEFLSQNKQNIPDYSILIDAYKDLFGAALSRSEVLRNQKKYSDALNDLTIATQICAQNMLQEKCDDKVLAAISAVKTAQYNEFLEKGKQATTANDFIAAADHFKQAQAFREGNEEEIKDLGVYKKLLQELYNAHLSQASKLMQTKNFSKATQLIADADVLDKQYDEITPSPTYQDLQQTANEAQYNNYLENAAQKRKAGQTEAAAEQLLAANDFAQKNAQKIRQNKLNSLGTEPTLIYEDLLNMASKALSSKGYEDALKSIRLAQTLKDVQFRNESNVKCQRLSFQAHTGIAKQAQDVQDYAKEIECLSAAKNAVSGTITATDFTKLATQARDGMVQAYDKLIQKELPTMREMASKTATLEAAMRKTQSILQIGQQNGIQPSANTAREFKELEASIAKKYCERMEQELLAQVATSRKHIESKQFDLAVQNLDKALAQAKQNKDCAPNTKDIENLRAEHLDAADYQDIMTKALLSIKQNTHANTLGLYQKADLWFVERQLKTRFNLVHLPLPEWLAQNANAECMQFCAAEICRSDLKSTLQILNTLVNKTSNVYDLYRAGEQIAAKEFNKSLKAKDVLLKYVLPKGEAAKKFSQGFKAQWKSLGGK
ncbi:MAG: hypothetical protein EAZ57_10330 [Cytophagales bacterium]|nr:MAG: hypothetical protein EAZ67_07050 [Cytophagales bacterium]TAF59636.1 MAG: hypothetical protein EAZ57_10330 [Cytophagales bacterium]